MASCTVVMRLKGTTTASDLVKPFPSCEHSALPHLALYTVLQVTDVSLILNLMVLVIINRL